MTIATLLLSAIAAVAAVWCALLVHRVHADLLDARLDIHETYFLLRDMAVGDVAWSELLEDADTEQEPTP